jgi:hypothetical protein
MVTFPVFFYSLKSNGLPAFGLPDFPSSGLPGFPPSGHSGIRTSGLSDIFAE